MATPHEHVPLASTSVWAIGLALTAGGLFTINAYMVTPLDLQPGTILRTYLLQSSPWIVWALLVGPIFVALDLLRTASRSLLGALAVHTLIAAIVFFIHTPLTGTLAWSLGLLWPDLTLRETLVRLARTRAPLDWLNYMLVGGAFHVIVYVRRLEASRERIRRLGQQRLEGLRALAGEVAAQLDGTLTQMSAALVSLGGRASVDRSELAEIGEVVERCVVLGRDLQAVGEDLPMDQRETTVGAVRRAFSMAARDLGRQRVRLTPVQPSESVRVSVDLERLRQAIVSLVLHLGESTAEPPPCELTIERRGSDPGADEGPLAVAIRVPRMLVGESDQPRLVEKDARIGLDLGFAAVRGIMHQMGGTFDIDSETANTVIHLGLPQPAHSDVPGAPTRSDEPPSPIPVPRRLQSRLIDPWRPPRNEFL